ncbi:hypothetical protein I79_020388 [Cricetulus griseus]|uniref:Uncharacterized protein n=1 Tax=Cricetulus griseus TaxID=10029 RepID=G3I9X7_CRIGR|nr:hypothetical protein I79_020388 [Cricetulus griseus]
MAFKGRPSLTVSRCWNPNLESYHSCPQLEPVCQHTHLLAMLSLRMWLFPSEA